MADHTQIGDQVVAAAKSGVSGVVPAAAVVRGNPAINRTAFARHQILVHRLPTMVQELRELIRRVEQLESSADHRA